MTRRFKSYLVATAAAAGFLAGTEYWAARRAASQSVAKPAPRPPLACRFQKGEALAWNVYSTSAVSNSQAEDTGTKNTGLDGVLWWKPVEDRGLAGWVVAAMLTDVRVATGAPETDAARRALWETPFLIEVGRDCRFKELRFSDDADPEARRQLAGMMRAIELVLSPVPTFEWVARHHDDLGGFDASYRVFRSADDAPKHPGAVEVTRTRSRYATMTQAAIPRLGGRMQVDILASQVHATVDPEGRFVRDLDDQEHLRIQMGGKLLSEVSAAVHLERKDGAGPLPPLLAALSPEQFPEAGKPGSASAAAPPPPAPDPVLAAQNLDFALADFTELLHKTNDGLYRATQRLAGYLATRPAAIDELLAKLRSGAIAPELHAALILAIQKTRSPAAERALAAAMADRGMTAVNRMRAAAALPDIPKPSTKTAAALIEQARVHGGGIAEQQVASAALLALGALSHKTRRTQPEIAELVRRDLDERLRTTRAREELAVALDAIGNTGDKSFVEAVRRYEKDDSEVVRAHAAQALRRMDLETSEPILSDWLGREEDPTVRRSIASALNEKLHEDQRAASEGTVTSAAARLAKEADAHARGELISLIGSAAASSAAAKEALVAQFHREKVTDLQVLIGRYVDAKDLR